MYNHAPFGFEIVGKALVENPKEIAVVNLIRERREDGWSLDMIATALNDDHVPTKLHERWYARTVKNTLDSDIYDEAEKQSVAHSVTSMACYRHLRESVVTFGNDIANSGKGIAIFGTKEAHREL